MVRASLQNMLETWEDAERKLRRKMRIYPTLGAVLKKRFPNDPLLRRRLQAEQDAEQRRQQDARENAIVSVNGKDLSSEDEIADAKELPEKTKKAA